MAIKKIEETKLSDAAVEALLNDTQLETKEVFGDAAKAVVGIDFAEGESKTVTSQPVLEDSGMPTHIAPAPEVMQPQEESKVLEDQLAPFQAVVRPPTVEIPKGAPKFDVAAVEGGVAVVRVSNGEAVRTYYEDEVLNPGACAAEYMKKLNG